MAIPPALCSSLPSPRGRSCSPAPADATVMRPAKRGVMCKAWGAERAVDGANLRTAGIFTVDERWMPARGQSAGGGCAGMRNVILSAAPRRRRRVVKMGSRGSRCRSRVRAQSTRQVAPTRAPGRIRRCTWKPATRAGTAHDGRHCASSSSSGPPRGLCRYTIRPRVRS